MKGACELLCDVICTPSPNVCHAVASTIAVKLVYCVGWSAISMVYLAGNKWEQLATCGGVRIWEQSEVLQGLSIKFLSGCLSSISEGDTLNQFAQLLPYYVSSFQSFVAEMRAVPLTLRRQISYTLWHNLLNFVTEIYSFACFIPTDYGIHKQSRINLCGGKAQFNGAGMAWVVGEGYIQMLDMRPSKSLKS